jgi:hypothetical protein
MTKRSTWPASRTPARCALPTNEDIDRTLLTMAIEDHTRPTVRRDAIRRLRLVSRTDGGPVGLDRESLTEIES